LSNQAFFVKDEFVCFIFDMTIVLENVRSAWNVGSVIRSCDALGCKLILVGYTPTPIGSNLKLISKTAIGAEKNIDWSHFDHSQEVFETFGNSLHLAIEISQKSQNIYDFLSTAKQTYQSEKDFLVWFGNEIHGVSDLVLERCQKQLHLDMHGKKESLNVSSCMCTIGYLIRYAFYI
jgi:23S rRNA (guanosine2251-2'-O)-methyltransferase